MAFAMDCCAAKEARTPRSPRSPRSPDAQVAVPPASGALRAKQLLNGTEASTLTPGWKTYLATYIAGDVAKTPCTSGEMAALHAYTQVCVACAPRDAMAHQPPHEVRCQIEQQVVHQTQGVPKL